MTIIKKNSLIKSIIVIFFLSCPYLSVSADSLKETKVREFPLTNFSKYAIKLSELQNHGGKRDSIPSISNPIFSLARNIQNIGKNEPVISISVSNESRAYPLRMLVWHEIVNDTVGGVPILVSFSPLCNSTQIFVRYIGDKILKFGNTGRLRNFNTIMFDTKTESWWQQYTGTSIVGDYLGVTLKKVPHRRESFSNYKKRKPNGKLMIPKNLRDHSYGTTPYIRMDSQKYTPSNLSQKIPGHIKEMDRLVIIQDQAWPISLLIKKKQIKTENIIISWWPGSNSIHDTRWIPFGKDIGNVSVLRKKDGKWVDAVYTEVFAFAFAAFVPEGKWNLK